MTSKTYAEQLQLASLLTRQASQAAIVEVALPKGSQGLDAGCGVGIHALWLCEETGGKVTGIDLSPDNLAAARKNVERRALADQIEFMEGDMLELSFRDDSFDWIWCADALWPVVIPDPVTVVREFTRVVKPGGTVAILFFSNQTFLPGYPQLEARLDMAFAANTHYLKVPRPDLHHMRALGWLQSAGLLETTARSFVAEGQAPLDPKMRESIGFWFSMLWENLKPHVSEEDWNEYNQICSPESKDFILNDPDYYCLVTYTLFHGRVPQV